MQGHQTWTPSAFRSVNRNQFMIFIVLLLFLLIGAAIGYFASAAAVRTATINVAVENDSGVSQDIRIFLNDDQVSVVNVPAGSTVTVPLKVGWTSTANGMYEVRASPTSTQFSDTDRVTVSNGQTLLVSLRVR